MGGATRFMTLLAAPFPPLRPSFLLLRHGLSTLTITPLRGWTRSSNPKIKTLTPRLVNSFHSRSYNNAYNINSAAASQSQQNHPWPEWTQFLNILSNRQGLSAHDDGELKMLPGDAFVAYEDLPDEFVRAASSCLAFARARPDLLGLLSRRYIEAVVLNGTPFLFRSALECSRRMRAFLNTNGSNVPESDRATTVDLMKYLISYASNPTNCSVKGGLYSRELVDSSVRLLLHELGAVSGAPTGYTPPPEHQFLGGYGQAPRPLGRNIEMKRGDWVCSKCNFMNFARNMKCLECEELRPKRQLTGREWECPQCNFFNYGKNLVCLRCDCRRPGAPPFNSINATSGSGYNGEYSLKTNMNSQLVENEERQHQFGEISPQRTLSSLSYHPKENSTLDTSIGRNLDYIFGRSSAVSERDVAGITAEQNTKTGVPPSISESDSSNYQYAREKNSNNASFVPLPADVFSKRDRTSTEAQETVSLKLSNQSNASNEAEPVGRNFQFLKNSSSQADSETQETEQAEMSESWFKKVVELHKAEDLSSEISDENFPDMMPMRKGENRFVVSKKKDRSLTSPKYKRQVAMDQANNTNFVPFVPFPPGYFARKEAEQPNVQDSPVKSMGDTSSNKITTESEKSASSKHIMDYSSTAPAKDIKEVSSENLELSRKFVDDTSTVIKRNNEPTSTGMSQFSGSVAAPPVSSSNTASKSWTDVHSGQQNMSQTNSAGPSSQVPGNENFRSNWAGKSLEGSAVKEEPDPLDMSEEAKTERWFKRVAQIKDISELSQIPDEDFPSIMPMRKGVNRFVVSKRKTPLERRLTSQQYRRNLPTVSTTDPLKRESGGS